MRTSFEVVAAIDQTMPSAAADRADRIRPGASASKEKILHITNKPHDGLQGSTYAAIFDTPAVRNRCAT